MVKKIWLNIFNINLYIIYSIMSDKEVKSSKKSNPWMTHLSKVRKANPKLSLKECMTKAKETYKKKTKKVVKSKKTKKSKTEMD